MGRKKPLSRSSRKDSSGQGPLRSQKNVIWKSQDWITRGLAFCMRHGPWREWEDRLLTALSLNLNYDFDSALTYCFDVLNRSWPALESVLVGGMLGPDCFRLSGWNLAWPWAFVQYVRHFDGSKSLESQILKQRAPAAAFAYATYGTGRRWPTAEPLILSGDTAASPALGLGPGDFLDPNQWNKESQAVTYARLFLESGWPDLEAKMANGKCHPQVACEYAKEILQGPLPDAIRNWLILESFDDEGSVYRKQYLAFEAAKRA